MNGEDARRGQGALLQLLPYLLNRTGGRMAVAFSRELRSRDLTYSAWRAIHTLWHLGPLSLVDLASRSNFEISTLSRIISDLERRGLLVRTEVSATRNGKADLTPLGLGVVETLEPVALAQEALALSCFTRAESMMLIELLQRLDANIDATFAGSTPAAAL